MTHTDLRGLSFFSSEARKAELMQWSSHIIDPHPPLMIAMRLEGPYVALPDAVANRVDSAGWPTRDFAE